MKKLNIIHLVLLLFLCNHAHAEVRNLETSRLKATGGTGVGSILMDESTILNPAPVAFFKNSSFYFQKNKSNFSNYESRDTGATNEGTAVIISDGKRGKLSGSVSYFDQSELGESKKTYAASMARQLSERSAFGVSYLTSKNRFYDDGNILLQESTTELVNFGIIHLLSESFSMGLIVNDVLKKTTTKTIATVGLQYVYQGFVSLLVDGGINYNYEPTSNTLFRIGMQFKVFEDVFLRYGYFEDKILSERGMGMGISWVGPKLMFDLALKNAKGTYLDSDITKSYDYKESSFSLGYYF